jgi:hypothetical protein
LGVGGYVLLREWNLCYSFASFSIEGFVHHLSFEASIYSLSLLSGNPEQQSNSLFKGNERGVVIDDLSTVRGYRQRMGFGGAWSVEM